MNSRKGKITGVKFEKKIQNKFTKESLYSLVQTRGEYLHVGAEVQRVPGDFHCGRGDYGGDLVRLEELE